MPETSNNSADWRRDPPKPYLNRAQLVRRPWREIRPGWDHDHCEFCYATFASISYGSALREGLCTLDEYHWICDDCVRDLDDEYHFVILQEAILPSIDAMCIRYGITEVQSPGKKLGRSTVTYDGSGQSRD